MTVSLPASLRCHADPRGLGGLAALIDRAEVALPLAEVRVRATIAGNVCRTVVEQVYINAIDRPVEAIYLFPLPEAGAVIGLALHAGEVVVQGEVRKREDAEAAFAEARASGHRAALLTAERADVHTMRVTMLPPGEEVRVRIEIIELLPMVDGALRWRFPTTIAPRFTPGTPLQHSGAGTSPDTDRAPDASRLQPPLRLEGGTRLDLEVHLEGRIQSIASSLHAVRMDLADGVRVAPSTSATLDRDFVLAIRAADTLTTQAWSDGSHTLVVVEPPALPGDALPRDAVFVVDISGSMGGEKLTAAKKALIAALHGLVPGDRFQVLAFDDRVEAFAEGLLPYDDRALSRADAWIQRLAARGGTEMLPALQAAFAGETPAGRSRTVLFITDGQATNDQELVACVHGRAGRTRLFTLGIDTAVNGALLSRLARIGGGTCELATPQDDIEALITRVEARFGAPLIDELRVEGHTAASLQTEALFPGRPATLLFEGTPPTVEVRGSRDFHVSVTPTKSSAPIAALWARARIEALEDRIAERPWEAEAARHEIARLGLTHHLASSRTAWIAVERRRQVDGTPVEITQPSELPAGWDEAFLDGGTPNRSSVPAASFGGAPSNPMPHTPGIRRMAARPAPISAPSPAAPVRARFLESAKSMVSRLMPGGLPASSPELGESDDAMPYATQVNAQPVPDLTPIEAPADAAPPAPKSAKRAQADTDSPARPAVSDVYRRERQLEVPLVREPAPPPYEASGPADPAGTLARLQGADGSFGGSVARTAAALLALILLGHTRRAGLRTRTAQKAAAWLLNHAADPAAALALRTLEAAEAGEQILPTPAWDTLRALREPEGVALVMALRPGA